MVKGVLGTLVGTLLIGVLNSGLAINNVNPYYQPIIIGTSSFLASTSTNSPRGGGEASRQAGHRQRR